MGGEFGSRATKYGMRSLLEESILVLGILLDILLEALILDHDVISGQHHERCSLLVLELLRPVPLAPDPPVRMWNKSLPDRNKREQIYALLAQQKSVKVIRESNRGERPRTLETRPAK